MKSLNQYITEESHSWANARKNATALKEFDKERKLLEQTRIGLEIIAKNHKNKLTMLTDTLKDEGQVVFVLDKASDNVPVLSDVRALCKELDEHDEFLEIYDKMEDLYVTFYFYTANDAYKQACKKYKDDAIVLVESIDEAKKESYFYGIKPFEIIWHGEWSDPELTDGEKKCNYYDVEDSLWDYWKNEVAKKKYKSDREMEDEFEKWMTSDDEAKELTSEYFYNVAK